MVLGSSFLLSLLAFLCLRFAAAQKELRHAAQSGLCERNINFSPKISAYFLKA